MTAAVPERRAGGAGRCPVRRDGLRGPETREDPPDALVTIRRGPRCRTRDERPRRTGLEVAREALASARAEARRRGLAPGKPQPAVRRRTAAGAGGRSGSRAAQRRGPGRPRPAAVRRRDPGPADRRARLGDRRRVGGVLGRWAAIVGPEIAAHAGPQAFEDGELVVGADSTAWATQLRLLAPTLLARLANELGAGVVTSVTVRGPLAPSWSAGLRPSAAAARATPTADRARRRMADRHSVTRAARPPRCAWGEPSPPSYGPENASPGAHRCAGPAPCRPARLGQVPPAGVPAASRSRAPRARARTVLRDPARPSRREPLTAVPDRTGTSDHCLRRQHHHRPRRSRGRPQAPGHVHRLHRRARPAPPRLRGRRQRGRRGAGRPLRPHRDRRCSPTAGSGSSTTAVASRSTTSRARASPAVEVVLTTLHAGGKFGGGGYTVSGGLHGVGVSVVNALSTRLEVEIRRDGHVWTPDVRASASRRPAATRATPTEETGTTITFWADPDIFETTDYDFETLSNRFHEMAFLNKGLTITLRDERPAVAEEKEHDEVEETTQTEVTYLYDGGLVDYVDHLNAPQGRRSTAIIVPSRPSRSTPTAGMSLEIAMQWNTSFSESVHTFANTINTHEGGTHEEGFRAALTTLVNTFAPRLEHPQGEGRQPHRRRRPRGPHRDRQPQAGRAAVRGPDQDQARQHRGQVVRAEGRQRAARRVVRAEPHRGQGHRPQGAAGARSPGSPRARPATLPAPQGAAGSAAACPASWPTASPPTPTSASCSSSRATPPAARPRAAATRESRRSCRSAGRSSTSRRRASTGSCRTRRSRRSSPRSGTGIHEEFDIDTAALPQGGADGRRRRRRPAHPHAAAHAAVPLHAPGGRAGPRLPRPAAAVQDQVVRPADGRVRLLRPRARRPGRGRPGGRQEAAQGRASSATRVSAR